MTDSETVTISRTEYAALLARAENLVTQAETMADLATLAAHRDEPTISQTGLERILAGESPVTVWREESGLSQRALAERAGISPSMLHAIEKGTRKPSLDSARRLAQALGISLDELFG